MVTINLKYTLVCLVLLALLVLLIVLCIAAKNLITTIKNLNAILEDTSVVSGIASEKATQVDGIVGDLGSAFDDVATAMKGNQSLVGAMTNVAKAVSSTVSYIKSSDPEEYFEAVERKRRKKNKL